MDLLLDTQALLWFLPDDPRLSENARQNIATQDALIFVSPASIWEIAIKISLGKYASPVPFASFWDEQLLGGYCENLGTGNGRADCRECSEAGGKK
jgi:PIN domain nuclease of toxin-antitoxin system